MLHDALAAAAFQQGSILDWDPDAYRQKTGGGVPRVLHQVFMDGEAEYNRCAARCQQLQCWCQCLIVSSAYYSTAMMQDDQSMRVLRTLCTATAGCTCSVS